MEKIIYQSGGPPKGTVFIKGEPQSKFRLIPSLFLLGGIFGFLLLFSPLIFVEAKYQVGSLFKKELGGKGELRGKQKVGFAEVIRVSDTAILQPVDSEFALVVPKIGLNSKVFPNVNPADRDEYRQVLKKGVAHAARTYLPGQGGTIFIFGHSTDYIWNFPQFKAVFYLLKELERGDEVNVFYQGRRYVYRVLGKRIVSPSDLYYLQLKTGKEELILQTCWPPGTTWKRLLVLAEPY